MICVSIRVTRSHAQIREFSERLWISVRMPLIMRIKEKIICASTTILNIKDLELKDTSRSRKCAKEKEREMMHGGVAVKYGWDLIFR